MQMQIPDQNNNTFLNYIFNDKTKSVVLCGGAYWFGCISFMPAVVIASMKLLGCRNENIALVCIPTMLIFSPLTITAIVPILAWYSVLTYKYYRNKEWDEKSIHLWLGIAVGLSLFLPCYSIAIAILAKIIDYAKENNCTNVKEIFANSMKELWDDAGRSLIGVACIMAEKFQWDEGTKQFWQNLKDNPSDNSATTCVKLLYASFAIHITTAAVVYVKENKDFELGNWPVGGFTMPKFKLGEILRYDDQKTNVEKWSKFLCGNSQDLHKIVDESIADRYQSL